MIIFDYSGTLSLEAPLFAAPDSLMKHLEVAGLCDFGIDSPSIFWEQLVNPTWVAGSTTNAGYKKVLLEHIIASLHPDTSMHRRVAVAVGTFVDRYLEHSGIDARWKPLLRRINAHPSIRTVIATDHYAEVTGVIIRLLGDWQIGAVTAAEAVSNPQAAASFIVANSADLGVHKADRHFWQILKTNLRIEAMRRILIIDDFGYNEQGADDYGKRRQVEARMKETVLTLETVFSAAVEVFPIMIGTDVREGDVRMKNLFEGVTAVIDRFLATR